MKPQVIINGDDFGMNERCSRAIAQAFALGLITDATVMANGAYVEEAAALARRALDFAGVAGTMLLLLELPVGDAANAVTPRLKTTAHARTSAKNFFILLLPP